VRGFLPIGERIKPARAACPFWALTARGARATARSEGKFGVFLMVLTIYLKKC